MSLDEQVAKLEGRVSKLEHRPKDIWDKLQIFGTLLIPFAIAFAGNVYARSMKNAELQSQEHRAQNELQVATTNARVGQAGLVVSLIDSLLSSEPKRQRLAIEAVLIALPDTGPSLVRIVSETDTDPAVRTFARNALSSRRLGLIAGLFADSAAQRIEAYNSLLSGWGSDSTIVPEVLSFAREHSDNADGIYNTLVFLSHMNQDALRPHVSSIDAFSREVENKGPRTKERAEKLRSRFPTGKQ